MDRELEILLARPAKNCDFCEYRNWVIINYLLNAGYRAATVRNIQNRDVDLESCQFVFRHIKSGRIQVSPLCSQMVSILADYMTIRKGSPEDYLFCNQYGEMLSENALRLAVAHYNKSRGIQKSAPVPPHFCPQVSGGLWRERLYAAAALGSFNTYYVEALLQHLRY